MTAIRAFREAYMTAGMEGFDDLTFSTVYNFEEPTARATRYDVLWAYYQGNAYRNLHTWAKKLKSDYGLYTHIRDIYNPSLRICNFHQGHIWGGYLDREAGDGSEVYTALPIVDVEDTTRQAIAQVWEWSRWPVKKDIITLYGAVYGDVFLKIVDLPDRERVYIDRVHPGWITDIRKNALEEITFYEMQYNRYDPERNNGQSALYTELAMLTEEGVQYRTFKDNKPFAWDGESEEWVVPYPFVPLVHIQHNDVGLGWGWAEIFPKLGTFRELDDQASKLGDQIRKMVDSPWFFSGVKPGATGGTITIQGTGEQNPTNPEISREETPIIYAHDTGADAKPLVSELDIEAALSNVKELGFEVERSYPELRTAMWRGRGQGDVSGRALLLARQEAEDKVHQRRVNYDDGLVVAHKMALAIAGSSGYEGFTGFSLEDWDTSAAHQVNANRPVFKPHPTEVLDQSRQLWTNAHLAERVGTGLEIFLKDQQWDQERIDEIINSDFYQMHLETLASQIQPQQSDESEGGSTNRGDISGRGSESGSQDFDVNTIKQVEG
jgi:hypothetical protein